MSLTTKTFYEFGEFRFDPQKRLLWRRGELVALQPKAIGVLALLLKDRGNLIERQEIIDKVWSDSFVEEGNLNHAVSALRKVLGGKIIQTVPRAGYRFTADVDEVHEDGARELLIEKRTVSTTLIERHEQIEDQTAANPSGLTIRAGRNRRRYLAYAAGALGVLVLAAGTWFLTAGAPGKAKAGPSTIKSLAILPLRSFSQANTDEELRLRITDALITKLGRFDAPVVRPTNSVLRFAGEQQDPIDAGRQLGVDAVLDGRVQEESGRLRVTLQLISVVSGEQLWSEQFDGRVGEILALQDSISARFRQEFEPSSGREPSRASTVSNDAYEAYLKGRFLWNQRRKESYYGALEYFERSVQIDPNFALGYTGIADSYYLLQRNVLSTIDAFEKAETAAKRALELDPNLAEAHASMGAINLVRYSRWRDAERSYLRAIELNPNFAETYGRLGMLYNCWSRFDEAEQILRKGESLDPTSLNLAIYRGANYYFSKQFDRAESQFKRILEFAPGTERAHFFLERIYEIGGRYDEAVEHALKEREVFRPASAQPLREAFQKGGIKGFWQKQIEMQKQELTEMHGLENHIASRYVLLGDVENACLYIGRNLENLGSMLNYGRVDPIFDPLRSTPCFNELMNKAEPII